MKEIQIAVTLEEANTILAALGQQPYLKVANLIQKIQRQGEAQVNDLGQDKAIEQEVQEILEQA